MKKYSTRLEDHTGLIQKLARQFAKDDEELFSELFQEGMYALVLAKTKYNKKLNIGFSTYGGKVAFHKMLRLMENRKKHFNTCSIEEWDALSNDLLDNLIKNEIANKCLNYLNNSPKKHKVDAFRCVYIDGESLTEKAKQYGVSVWTIRQRATDVRKELKELIEGE